MSKKHWVGFKHKDAKVAEIRKYKKKNCLKIYRQRNLLVYINTQGVRIQQSRGFGRGGGMAQYFFGSVRLYYLSGNK